jgi:hypothetical protein
LIAVSYVILQPVSDVPRDWSASLNDARTR